MKLIKTNDQGMHYIKVLCTGDAGVGKTRMVRTTGCIPDTVVISAEGGLLSLRDTPLTAIECSSKDDVLEAYRWVCESDEARGIQWVCVDSISEIAEQVLSHERTQSKDPRRAYGELAIVMDRLIKSFRDLDKHIYMTCKTERVQTEQGLLWVPSLPGQKLGNSLPYLFDEVFQLCCAKDEESGAIKRWLQCHNDGTRLCKDRSGALDMFEPPSLAHILQKIMKKGEE
tara:strand:+ start:1001 stop:1684 length:684 start_codon:yes stop_codon:yes gene_type:complete